MGVHASCLGRDGTEALWWRHCGEPGRSLFALSANSPCGPEQDARRWMSRSFFNGP